MANVLIGVLADMTQVPKIQRTVQNLSHLCLCINGRSFFWSLSILD